MTKSAPSSEAEHPRRYMRWEAGAGAVEIHFPEPMSKEDLDDLEATLQVWFRVMRRSASIKRQDNG
jgi:hypothetical protein